jgi:hypothetical protein
VTTDRTGLWCPEPEPEPSAPRLTFRRIRRLARRAARRLAVGGSLVAGASWWAVTTVAASGLSLVVGTVALVVSGALAALGWIASGE